MKREDIEKAAKRFYFFAAIDLKEKFILYRGFKDGAKWRIDSVWNDVRKEPKINEFFVFENEHQEYETDCFYKNINWKVYVAENDVKRWAYIKDLIPELEE